MDEELAMICFGIISNSGSAKSCYIEAIQKAKEGDFTGAETLMTEGENCFHEAHTVHLDLITNEASGDGVLTSLLLIHAEDQMANAEMAKVFAEEIISLYKKLA